MHTNGGGLTGLYHCWHTNYCYASRLSLFYQTGTFRRAPSGSESLLLLVVSQQTSHRSIHAFHIPWLFSCLECSVKEVLTEDLSARAVGAGRLLIARSMNNITGPTDARTEPGYKLNCTRRGTVGGARDWINSMGNTDIRPCSNNQTLLNQRGLTIMIC